MTIKKYKNNISDQNNKKINLVQITIFILIIILTISTIIFINTAYVDVSESDSNISLKEAVETVNKEYIVNNTEKANSFILPLDGKCITNFSTDELIYSSTLDDWRCHNGIDISAQKNQIVKSMNAGQVTDISNDDLYGTTITINHIDNVTVKYCNIDVFDGLKVGDSVAGGMIIGYINSNPPFEGENKLHIHIEAFKNEQLINPLFLIN